MARFRLIVEYDGTGFVGWQRQSNGLAVQEVLEAAMAAVEGRAMLARAAGRTDTGVHALGQCVHADFFKPWRGDQLRDALNAHLRPHRVAVVLAAPVSDSFDARHSAIRRTYLYRILNRRAPLTLDAQRLWLVKRRLDAASMHAAAQRLLGQHDFSTFRDSDCQADSPVRTLERMDVEQAGQEIRIHVAARSFLHRQVRSMVGSLEHVGARKWSGDDLYAALCARDRSHCGQVAPAAGLYLVRVDYLEGAL